MEAHLLGRTRTKSATAFTAHLSWSQEYVPSARATTDARMTPIWPPDNSRLDVGAWDDMGAMKGTVVALALGEYS